MPADRELRRFSAVACGVVAAVAGYALHRAVFAVGEPDPRTVGPSEHIGYFWRVATALWWAGLAAIGGWRFPSIGPMAARSLPWVVAAAVVVAFLLP